MSESTSPTLEIDRAVLGLLAREHEHWRGSGGIPLAVVRQFTTQQMGIANWSVVLDVLRHFRDEKWIELVWSSGSQPDPMDETDSRWRLTTRGLHRARTTTSQFPVRIQDEARSGLARIASSHGMTANELAATALREWVRMQEFPGVEFRWTLTSGRQPFVAGTRLTVWFVHELWLANGRDARVIAEDYPNLQVRKVEAARAYVERHMGEMPPPEVPPPGIPVFKG